jgi:predicted ATPase
VFLAEWDPGICVSLTAAYLPVWLDLSLSAELRVRAERALKELDPNLNLSARLRMELQIALGTSLIITLGPVERTRIVLTSALDLAEGLDDSDVQVRALWALWALHFNTGECRAAQSAAERFSRAAFGTGDEGIAAVAHRAVGYTLQYGGNQREARCSLERALDLNVNPESRRPSLLFVYDQHVLARATLARSLWLQGFVNQAENVAQASLADAQAREDKLTLCFVLGLALCPLALATGDRAAAERWLTMPIDIATRRTFTQYEKVARGLEGMLRIEGGEFAAGTALLTTALDMGKRTGWTADAPTYLGYLARGFAGLGQIDKALATVDQALARAEQGGERWYVPELLRIKGEFLLRTDQSSSAAEDCFLGAIDLARDQGALFWELRSALSLARLRERQARRDEAIRVLAPVYDRFTEGFATADLKQAKALLD